MLSEKSILESLRSYKDIPCPGVKGHVPVPDWLMHSVVEYFEGKWEENEKWMKLQKYFLAF